MRGSIWRASALPQNRELAETGAGNRFDLEQAEADLRDLEAQVTAAIASEAQVRAQLAAVVDGDIASIAKIKADLANAEWELQQTTVAVALRVLRHQPAAAARRLRRRHAVQSR